MKERLEIILKLLNEFHLNVKDRLIFKENPLRKNEIEVGIKTILNTARFFPNRFLSWDKDRFNYDGFVIEKASDNQYLVHFQVSGAYMNLIESKTYYFPDLESAIDFYTENEIKDNIDGIEIKNAP